MKIVAVASLLAVIVASASPVLAGPVGVQRQPVQNQAALAQLEAAKAKVAEQALTPTVKGPLRFCYMKKQDRIETLIDLLRSGEHVSGSEINRALASC